MLRIKYVSLNYLHPIWKCKCKQYILRAAMFLRYGSNVFVCVLESLTFAGGAGAGAGAGASAAFGGSGALKICFNLLNMAVDQSRYSRDCIWIYLPTPPAGH